MITIDFSLFAFMRNKMHAPFNVFLDSLKYHRPNTYKQDLGIIYNSPDLLNSEYASDSFREGAKDFFNQNKGSFVRKVGLKMADRMTFHREYDYYLNLIDKYKTLEEVKQHVAEFFNQDLPDVGFFNTDNINYAWENFSKFSGNVGLKDLKDYYTLCLSDKRDFLLKNFLNGLSFFAFFLIL